MIFSSRTTSQKLKKTKKSPEKKLVDYTKTDSWIYVLNTPQITSIIHHSDQ